MSKAKPLSVLLSDQFGLKNNYSLWRGNVLSCSSLSSSPPYLQFLEDCSSRDT